MLHCFDTGLLTSLPMTFSMLFGCWRGKNEIVESLDNVVTKPEITKSNHSKTQVKIMLKHNVCVERLSFQLQGSIAVRLKQGCELDLLCFCKVGSPSLEQWLQRLNYQCPDPKEAFPQTQERTTKSDSSTIVAFLLVSKPLLL